jgi:hypothetical protein
MYTSGRNNFQAQNMHMMKTKIVMLLVIVLIVPKRDFAQTTLNKSIPVQAGQTIDMKFDYPQLVKVSTWEKNEIQIGGTVSINNGENDDAFILESSQEGKTIKIRSEIRNIKSLPERVTVFDDGKKMMFKNKAEFKKYQQEHGKTNFNCMSFGADIDITIEIKVPRNMTTRVESVYGIVEVKDFSGPLTVEATYGGVDAALAEKSVGEIEAETNYGQIYTNFDTKFGGEQGAQEDFHMFVSAKPGAGPKYSFESKYGNVYLRKAIN